METIFVSIACFRDPECQWTVNDLFQKAFDPSRINVGICWQYDTENSEDSNCFLAKYPFPNQVRTIDIHWREAKGPIYARYLIQQKLYNNEKYYLQIDSHMRFIQDWDKKMIFYLNSCPNPSKAILTTYPPGYELPNKIPVENINRPTILVADEFSSKDGFLRIKSKLLTSFPNSKNNNNNSNSKLTIKSIFWAAGFSFSSSDIIKQVPYDPHLEFLFFGEEISMIVRLFTHGWEFYSPPQSLIFHLWTRSYRSTFQSDTKVDEFKLLCSQLRVKLIIGEFNLVSLHSYLSSHLSSLSSSSSKSIDLVPYLDRITKDLDKYGLGQEKTIEDFVKETGVDFIHKTISEKAKSGGNEEYKLFFFDNFLSNLISQVKK